MIRSHRQPRREPKQIGPEYNLPQVDGGDFTPIDPSTLPPGMRAVAPARVSAPAGETPA